ncbi:helix-turn-helix domain-containing protein [Williamsia phyllosphaerae]|uniref:HTH cro/C1-type domain-containing protein n=1 Tax=Williamsia phyllosphaerae TaxID=885042 RepID=A0ABQ1V3U1_9NOCA|nr:helix-turn-helix transcriptional regulator [Williamsia phyllosphaerae]GGF35377.1 hypothetical protein GCM10007298_34000 [Williamsia phyllosphaerae]
MNLKHGIPEPWATALTDAGFISPWDTPSMNRLSEATGIHVSTISRIIKGQNLKGPTHDVIATLAKALGKPAKELGKWAGAAWAELEPYSPPAVSALLTKEQRASVDMIIRAFATSNKAAQQDADRAVVIAAQIATKGPSHRAQSKKTT